MDFNSMILNNLQVDESVRVDQSALSYCVLVVLLCNAKSARAPHSSTIVAYYVVLCVPLTWQNII